LILYVSVLFLLFRHGIVTKFTTATAIDQRRENLGLLYEPISC